METWQHYSPNIVIDWNTYVIYEYCTHYLDNWQCVEWIQVVPKESLEVQNKNNVESYSNTAVFVIVIMLLVWLVKWIFRLILPSKWKK